MPSRWLLVFLCSLLWVVEEYLRNYERLEAGNRLLALVWMHTKQTEYSISLAQFDFCNKPMDTT